MPVKDDRKNGIGDGDGGDEEENNSEEDDKEIEGNPGNSKVMQRLVEAALGPDEREMGVKLKTKLNKNTSTNGFEMVAEFDRYLDLFEKPKIFEMLRENREKLFFALMQTVDNFRDQVDGNKFSKNVYIGSTILSKLYTVGHLKSKMEHVAEVSKLLLKDIPNFEGLDGKVKNILTQLYLEEKQCIAVWAEGLKVLIKRDEISLKEEEKVIEFSEGSRQMEVNYNPHLSKICEETQQLLIMGYEVPKIIVQLVTKAKKFSKQARELDQIAQFHNTIGDRMIPSQRPMMLDTAVALSKLVSEQHEVAWSHSEEVQVYIDALKAKVTDLAKQNSYISTLHLTISQKVKSLFEADLIKQPGKWKEVLKDIRDSFKDVERRGFKHRKSWENHWDRQLYKVLEIQYISCLSTLNENLPEISVELVYRQDRLQFQPPLEELKTMYYNNIRKLINIPRDFRGVSEEEKEESIFVQIIKRHNHRYERVFTDGEKMFDRMVELQTRFVDWIALGVDDAEYLGTSVLKTADEWDRSLKQSKARGQQVVKLNCSDVKVGCFVVTFKLLRLEIELLNRKYWEVLVSLLSTKIIEDMTSLEKSLQDGIGELEVDPESLEEISKANLAKEELSVSLPSMKETLESIEARNRVLGSWTKEKYDLNRIKSLWDKLTHLMDNYHRIIGMKVENLKAVLNVQALAVNNEMENFKLRWDQLKPKDSSVTKDPAKFDAAIQYISQMKSEWMKLIERRETIENSFASVSSENLDVDFSSSLDDELESYEQTWSRLGEFRAGFKEFENEDWIVFRAKPFRFEEFLQEWDTKLRNQPKDSDFIFHVLKDIEECKTIIPNVKYLRGDIFAEKHWIEIFNALDMPRKPVGELKLGDFLTVKTKINDNLKELKEINSRAAGEVTVTQALNELDAWDLSSKFQLAESVDSHGRPVYIVEDFKSVLNKIGDNQSLLQSIRTSPYFSNFADRITMWETKLADLDEYLQSVNKIQRRWIYLEPIFSHGVLESEQQRFRRIDEEFRQIMEKIHVDSRVSSLGKVQNIKSRLSTLLDQLSRCQSSLNEYLEKKRSGFPRFYFIGDDDLLEILGQSTKPSVIQAHLKKLFAGIHNVDFDDNNQFIVAMKSLEGEVVYLKTKVKITPNVEEWLNELSTEMKCTLKSLLLDCVSDSKHDSKDPDKYPTQILCLSNSIVFTDQCEEAIRSGRLSNLQTQLKQDLRDYADVRIKEGDPTAKVLELKLKDLILEVIHQVDVVDYLITKKVKSVTDWHWQKQLRFYIRDDGDGTAIVRMADSEFAYSYEYQGNAPRLVHTPLTDKCYLTLTQGMRMGLGGNPYGPAGTGKTESVKALGSLLGRQVLVFNCDEGIDVKSMGRIFMGLIKCGAWGCFDEFNRLEGATLSAVSMQIQPIQTALKQGSKSVVLMEEEILLDPNAGIFVTLNPAGQGYGGRNKLPDNLKQLFRPVVMSHPDNDRIAEVILYTEGYRYAKKIGKKLVEVFSLCEKVLTRQPHYDWGLRALKTVLKGCGSALNELVKSSAGLSEKIESDIAVSSLRLNTLPKLTYSDCFRFDTVITDVFPDVTFRDLGNDDLADHIREAYKELNLELNENQVRKCLELYEQLQQRMGVVIVGPPMCGKSTILNLLKHAMAKMKKKVKVHSINPKAMPRKHLLGHINLDTRQWNDGILTLKAQQVYSEPPEITSWIICDGDIDPEWIESLNSVLDDNRLLTLPSGWRIKFGPNVNFVFETHDLSLASPATISRMGIILMSEEDTNITGLINSWLREQPVDLQPVLRPLIDDYLLHGLATVSQISEPVLQVPKASILQNALSLLSGVQTKAGMAITLINGLSGSLNSTQITDLSQKILDWTMEANSLTVNKYNLFLNPQSRKIESYQDDPFDVHEDLTGDLLPLVKTSDVKRVLDTIRPWLKSQEPFMLVGPEGSGKSMILQYALNEIHSTEVAVVHCSSLISPENVLLKLSQVCITMTTNTGRVYKPKNGERLILYFKDINLVKPDKWGTCQMVEFLRQIVVYSGFYDKSLEWVTVQGIQVVASISVGNITGGRYNISPRFTSRIRICSMSQPQADQLYSMCGSFLTLLSKKFIPTHPFTQKPQRIEALAAAMVKIFNEVRGTFTPVAQSHYQFTPKDLTNWVMGLMRYDVLHSSDCDIKGFYTAWAFEACRLFRDKLVSSHEKQKFDDVILSPVLNQLGMGEMIKSVTEAWWISSLASSAVNQGFQYPFAPIFGPSLVRIASENLVSVVEKGITMFGREHRTLTVVITSEVLENIAFVDRILSAPASSLLLAGRAGVGRKTAVSIVAALHNANIVSLKIGRNYNLKSFKNDIKTAIQESAIEGNKTFLILEDFQLIDVVFLDMINCLLSSGEIPGLYTQEEMDVITSTLRDVASNDGYTDSTSSFFIMRVKKFLQIVLILDHTNEDFVKNCQNNPALYKNCSLLWIESWGEKAIQSLPSMIIKRFYGLSGPELCGFGAEFSDPRRKQVFARGFQTIYESASKDMAVPRRFISLIHNHALIYLQKHSKISDQMEKLKAGITKLQEARQVVESLKTAAFEQESVLAEKQADANKALEMMTLAMQNTNVQQKEMEQLREKTMKESGIIAQKKKEIDAELAEIEPLVQSARSAVGNLKNESLSEIRSLRAPPEIIRDILEAVLRLMGTRDMSWNSMKSFLSKRGVKDEIRSFDARNIDKADREAVEQLIKLKHESFDPKNAKRASAAAAPLADWVLANVKYSKVLQNIGPLEKQQASLMKNLSVAEAHMSELNAELDSVEKRVGHLKIKLNQNTKEAAEIEFHLNKAKQTLGAAEELVGKLNDEFTRWSDEMKDLEDESRELPLFSLIAAAFITFLCNAPEDTRVEYVQRWCKELDLTDFDFKKFLCSERDLLQLQSLGLPTDDLSHENAIIILQTCLRPYVVDPSSRATAWLIKELSKTREPVIISLQDPKFATELELAIRFGKTIIVQEADSIEPILIPILRCDFISQGSRDAIPVGDKLIDYNASFRLYLCTRKPNPLIPPDAAAVLTVVNFTTTRAGLVNQLLTTTLSNEKPEVQKKKTDLVKNIESLKLQLEQLGDTLLQELATAQGNILENTELLASLNKTKSNSIDIRRSLKEATVIEESLNKDIEVFQPLAEFGSRLYFATIEVSQLNPIYQFSLSSFLSEFKRIFSVHSWNGTQIEERIQNLSDALLDSVYEFVCQGLFKTDKMAFALHLTHLMHPDEFLHNEWEAFTGQLVGDIDSENTQVIPSWVAEDRKFAVQMLASCFPELFQLLNLKNNDMWTDFYTSSDCEENIPQQVKAQLTPFQEVMLMQTLRPDRLYTAMYNFAKKTFGKGTLFSTPPSLKQILEMSRGSQPILMLTSAGADPSQEIRELAEANIGISKYIEMSMGQGEQSEAFQKLRQAAQSGSWMCMKNLHLVTHMLEPLEKEIRTLKPNETFRLWLTSEPHEAFPKILAQSCLKIAYEAPQGVKKNLQRTFASWPAKFLVGDKNIIRTQALFVLAVFHAIIQERRTYIPQGWSKEYEFNDSDLRAGADVVDQFFKATKTRDFQWAYIHGLFINAVYGGKIDNEFDIRVLDAYLTEYFNDLVLTGGNQSKKTFGPGLNLPTTTSVEEYIKQIEGMPENDKPGYFGLPSNIEKSWQRIASGRVISQLKYLSIPFDDTTAFDRTVWNKELTPVLNVWKKLHQEHGSTSKLQDKIDPPGTTMRDQKLDPIESFVKLEYYNIVSFMQTVHKILGGISKVVRGIITPTEELKVIADSLMRREVPYEWTKVWEGPEDAVLYLTGLVARATAVKKWSERLESGELFRYPVDLSDLISPDTFFYAFKQLCARKLGVSMDALQLLCVWDRSTLGPDKLSCQLTGILLEGCTFNGVRLVENTSADAPISRIVDCTVAWVTSKSDLPRGHNISVPLYVNERRKKLITTLTLPVQNESAKWIKTGIALFLKT